MYNKSCSVLATAPDATGLFIPGAVEWRTDIIDLSVYNNTNNVKIRFKNEGGWGQPIYIDNIQITGSTLSLLEYESKKNNLTLYPNPSSNYISIAGLTQTENYIIYNINGSKINEGKTSDVEKINIENLTNGFYFLKMENRNMMKFIKI